ncbi:DUF4747 family protein [uncultured Erythrobacter sp.]|uniref:DUF4747 family protein n=1 Tax=uncultured Erythrobacter sp. TaxID=263913 RepID=UPI0026017224|nr:DUF4747 family protein [uncultured Erythrobacter sp.]
MGQKALMRSGVINIRAHPNSEYVYASLIQRAYQLKAGTKLRGDRYGVISLLNTDTLEAGFVEGILTTFTKVDTDSEWFDLENLQEAAGEKVAEISIPENLYPNPKSFHFVFKLKSHKLFLQTYSKGDTLSIRDATRMFERLLQRSEIQREFGDVKVTMVQSRQSLDRIFALEKITKVSIKIERPNADIFDGDFEERIQQHLAATGSRQFEVAYTAERGGSVNVSDEIRRVSQPALANGKIDVEGRTAEGKEKRSTNEHPELRQMRYDTDEQTEAQAMRDIAGE